MKQALKKSIDGTEIDLNRIVTDNFLEALDEFVKGRLNKAIANERELANFIHVSQSRFSQMRKEEGNQKYYVTVEILAKVVNELGINANFLLAADKKTKKKEKLLRDNITINSDGSGVTNNVVKSKGNKFINGSVLNGDNHGTINTAEKIIQGMPKEEREALQAVLDGIKSQNEEMNSEVATLKKMIDQHKKREQQLQEKVNTATDKYISLLEDTQKRKK